MVLADVVASCDGLTGRVADVVAICDAVTWRMNDVVANSYDVPGSD